MNKRRLFFGEEILARLQLRGLSSNAVLRRAVLSAAARRGPRAVRGAAWAGEAATAAARLHWATALGLLDPKEKPQLGAVAPRL